MAAPLSLDLKYRIRNAIEKGEESYTLLADRFNVSRRSIARVAAKMKRNESLEPRPIPGAPKKLAEKHLRWLKKQVEKNPHQSSYDLQALYCKTFPNNPVHRSTILRALHGLRLSYKKNGL